MTRKEAKSCIGTIEMLQRLAYNIHGVMDVIDVDNCKKIIKALEQEPKWTPIKTRPLTDEEKEEYANLGYSEDSMTSMYDCPLPEDGEEVLITTRYDTVCTDTFYRDDGCYFETYCDEDDVKAWMPLPEPYKAESEVQND